jgi:hypothetical protein
MSGKSLAERVAAIKARMSNEKPGDSGVQDWRNTSNVAEAMLVMQPLNWGREERGSWAVGATSLGYRQAEVKHFR